MWRHFYTPINLDEFWWNHSLASNTLRGTHIVFSCLFFISNKGPGNKQESSTKSRQSSPVNERTSIWQTEKNIIWFKASVLRQHWWSWRFAICALQTLKLFWRMGTPHPDCSPLHMWTPVGISLQPWSCNDSLPARSLPPVFGKSVSHACHTFLGRELAYYFLSRDRILLLFHERKITWDSSLLFYERDMAEIGNWALYMLKDSVHTYSLRLN